MCYIEVDITISILFLWSFFGLCYRI